MNLIVAKEWAAKPAVIGVGAGILGFGTGAAVSYVVTKRILDLKYEELLKEELDAAKKFYKVLYKDGFTPTTSEEVEEIDPTLDELTEAREKHMQEPEFVKDSADNEEIIEEQGYFPPDDGYEEPEVHTPIPEEELKDASWVWNEEDALAPEPEVITEADFRDNIPSHRQVEWVYYEEDGSLVDETENKIFNVEEVLGEINLRNFDDLSENQVELYVRNAKLSLDIYITIDYGSWEKQQLSYEEENALEHAYRRDSRKVRKFRSDDG